MKFAEDLWIKPGEKVTIDNEVFKIKKVLSSCLWLTNEWENLSTTKEYCIDNIAHLLQLNPSFQNEEIQSKIETIQLQDWILMTTRQRMCELENRSNDLLWEWKTYIFHDKTIRYSYGTSISKDWRTLRPSATPITSDILGFNPINKIFSTDEEDAYYTYHRIWSTNKNNNFIKPNIKKLEVIQDSDYCYDDENVFNRFNYVEWAKIIDWGYEIIKHEETWTEVLIDSNKRIFAGHEDITGNIKNPKLFKHVFENFFFDGTNVYRINWLDCHNITELFSQDEWANIQKIESKEEIASIKTRKPWRANNSQFYKIGDSTFAKDSNGQIWKE